MNGCIIIDLLNGGLKTEQFVDSRRLENLFSKAERSLCPNPTITIQNCLSGLDLLNKPSFQAQSDLNRLRYTRGLFLLLSGAAYLNDLDRDLLNAKTSFELSIDEFASRKWLHLESLAFLGLAITNRKLKDFDEAEIAINSANERLRQEWWPDKVQKEALSELQDAITAERESISKGYDSTEYKPNQKKLPIFKMSAGAKFAARNSTVDVNLFSLNDYLENADWQVEVIIDLVMYPQASRARYILVVDDNISEVLGDLTVGSWILIREETSPDNLSGRSVAVLALGQIGGATQASIRTFFKAEDHYFLMSKARNVAPIILSHYNSDRERIMDYYQAYSRVNFMFVYDLRLSGRVVGIVSPEQIASIRVHQEEQEEQEEQVKIGISRDIDIDDQEPEAAEDLVWTIPVYSDISAGLGRIAEGNPSDDYREINIAYAGRVDFGVYVRGDSMTGDGITNGDLALFREQKRVEQSEIAAILITTAEDTVGVLKRYYAHGKSVPKRHYFLKSSNPASKHLVVIPPESNATMVRDLYRKAEETGKMQLEYYEDARLDIAGKFVDSIKPK